MYCWGSSIYGQVGPGDPTIIIAANPLPVRFALVGKTIQSIACGAYTSYAVATTGEIFSWGKNDRGQRGDGNPATGQNTYMPEAPISGLTATAIFSAAMGDNAFALGNDSSYYSWGDNTNYGAGYGSSSTYATRPTKIPLVYPEMIYADISPGKLHSTILGAGITCFGVFAKDPNVCTSHGTCTSLDTCVCRAGYVDVDCSLPLCYGYVYLYCVNHCIVRMLRILLYVVEMDYV